MEIFAVAFMSVSCVRNRIAGDNASAEHQATMSTDGNRSHRCGIDGTHTHMQRCHCMRPRPETGKNLILEYIYKTGFMDIKW